MPLIHTSTSVGTTEVTIVPAGSENYQFLAIANNGSKTAYLKMVPSTVALSVTNGIALPAGVSVMLDQDVTPILITGISAICGSGDTTTLAAQAY